MDVELIIALAQEHGLKRLRVGDIEVELWEKPRQRYSQAVPVGALVDESIPDDEEDLFYSVE
jgi:hypothetical protein|tara:strand:- start:445 stop:630 length:186 start_codon:yes stop_codon:yes gene_type:complete